VAAHRGYKRECSRGPFFSSQSGDLSDGLRSALPILLFAQNSPLVALGGSESRKYPVRQTVVAWACPGGAVSAIRAFLGLIPSTRPFAIERSPFVDQSVPCVLPCSVKDAERRRSRFILDRTGQNANN
jgi:hypothetical protein